MKVLEGKRILLIIAGGIAAYKSLDLIRRLRERGAAVRCILTHGGSQFITPMSVAALSEERVFQDLFSLTDEAEIGHIRLSREADLVVVAPATADLMAKMAAGLADDLASTALLATDKEVLIAPSMNVMMWQHPATRANVELLRTRGIHVVDPGTGDLACGEEGAGRMAEPLDLVAAIERHLGGGPLAGRRALVTSGPTHEPVDPVRYLGNRSSGRQGHAIAAALAASGADTVLVSGPTALPDPTGVRVVRIETAAEMLIACEQALPADVAVCAAAVADWRPAEPSTRKRKKDDGPVPALELVENPDILAALSRHPDHRPSLVIGFAAETDNVLDNATVKLERKGCDWIVANGVGPGSGTFDGDRNTVTLLTGDEVEPWPEMDKTEVARRLVDRIASALSGDADD